ncbi:bifunctional DNA-formamidopyrimidine glycosylase/DNA-(apurinic or apyrimidinic site) lyase [Sulfuriroseicoccus oceanibius]|uniref:Formamidopyrimidine-DNA glycosylase n=1 Tax=Sulfuriroseicoccus oceanibius TaxID=2707525 RepID=A0A6B3LB73_9BACT|nr:bifunctional DNA-formamidopyrimidine glycosylase/DNA-(apurinic or apyrimidinic site) lyase [Sulfuriroseicoccus oceanibius]QQL45902.1 bifunctional DNA-formamidopyrimidine glycosylase/DNA-(apurinic or apyrimidinic site) lyase [Sulfuriroseicoccus oceanibius]
MPELPEVETTARGVRPHLVGRKITRVDVHQPRLRVHVPEEVEALAGSTIRSVSRRAKYLLIDCGHGHLIIHLGMSGSLRMADPSTPLKKHDHVVIHLDDGSELRYHDPRRFGIVTWTAQDPLQHELLAHLGPEPLTDAFDGNTLVQAATNRRCAVKLLIMNNEVVVGVGNIYACEALFLAGIHPKRQANRISTERYQRLVTAIKDRLAAAIEQGGTTLRDFVNSDGQPGYFAQQLHVYGREGESCNTCGSTIKRIVLGQRSTFFCPKCQR